MMIHQPSRKPLMPSAATDKARTATAKPTKPYFTSLPLNDHCLNFRANSGNSHTSRKLVQRISTRMRNTDQLWLLIQLGLLTTSEPQNRALAGVGTPMKEVV